MAPIASAATSVLQWRPGCAGAYRCGGAAAAAAAAAGARVLSTSSTPSL